MLKEQRKRKLKKEFPNGKTIDKAFVQFYIKTRINHNDPNFKTTLTTEEINYLRSKIKTRED